MWPPSMDGQYVRARSVRRRPTTRAISRDRPGHDNSDCCPEEHRGHYQRDRRPTRVATGYRGPVVYITHSNFPPARRFPTSWELPAHPEVVPRSLLQPFRHVFTSDSGHTVSDIGVRNSVPVNHECIGCQRLESLTALMESRPGQPRAENSLGSLSVVIATAGFCRFGSESPPRQLSLELPAEQPPCQIFLCVNLIHY